MDDQECRVKRQKVDRAGRFAALEKLKQQKGQKNKYSVSKLENVYDIVDESEYADRVYSRQENDWIEDDGTGYVEDGREIFDDDEEDTYAAGSSKESSNRGQKRKKLAAQPSSKGNIRNLLGSMPTKKKEEIKTIDDSILSEIMSDLDSAGPTVIKPKPLIANQTKYVDSSKRDAQNYFKSLSNSIKNLVNPSAPVEKPQSKIVKDEPVTPLKKTSSTESKKDWSIDPILKQDSATQQIEEFNTQDFQFDSADFSNDGSGLNITEPTPKVLTRKKEIAVKSQDNISEIAIEFLNDDELFPIPDDNVMRAAKLTRSLPKDSWTEQGGSNENIATAHVDSGKLPLHTNEKGKKVLKMYWLDAWEDRFVKPGVVYLFGKVYVDPSNKSAGCVSCCVVVKNISRKLFLLPREYVS